MCVARMVMKKVRLARQTEAQRKASFREMELVQGLNHPFVVRCHDAWVERGHTICVVYGYCDAGDLASFLQRKAKVSARAGGGTLLGCVEITDNNNGSTETSRARAGSASGYGLRRGGLPP